MSQIEARYERDAARRLWVGRVYGSGHIVHGRTVREARERLLRATGYDGVDVRDCVVLPTVLRQALNFYAIATRRGTLVRSTQDALARAFIAMGLGVREAAALADVSATTMWRWMRRVR